MRKIRCEICKEGQVTCISAKMPDDRDMGKVVWKLVCDQCEFGDYDVEFSRLFKSPEEFADWMIHLQEKVWFSADGFLNAFKRSWVR